MNSSLQFSRHDVADPISVLSLADSPLEPLAPGFVRIEVKARAVNPADILFIQGIYGNMVGDQIKVRKENKIR
jgi:NADPH:quinone reductase-like Zn-dependent oxidoreductase